MNIEREWINAEEICKKCGFSHPSGDCPSSEPRHTGATTFETITLNQTREAASKAGEPKERRPDETTTQYLFDQLIAAADELKRLNNLTLKPVGDTMVSRPTDELRKKIFTVKQQGAEILKKLEPLLDTTGQRQLNMLFKNRWEIQKFDEEIPRHQPMSSARPEESKPNLKSMGAKRPAPSKKPRLLEELEQMAGHK
jgi:hypothetical protein